MASRARGLRLPEELEAGIEHERRLRGTTFSEEAVGLLREALRMRRIPGVVFVDGVASRRAVVAGTGIEVWEVVATYKELGEDREELETSYYWLSKAQLRAALAYYESFPEEIEERLSLEEYWTEERVRAEMPFATPRE